jgi:hypothetical protein
MPAITPINRAIIPKINPTIFYLFQFFDFYVCHHNFFTPQTAKECYTQFRRCGFLLAFVNLQQERDIASDVPKVRQTAILIRSVWVFEPLANMSHKSGSIPFRVNLAVTALSVLFCAVGHNCTNRFNYFGWHKIKSRLAAIVF